MLVSDLPIALWGLEKLLQDTGPQVELADSATDCGQAARIIYDTPINVIVVDLDGDIGIDAIAELCSICLLYTSPSPRDRTRSRMPSSA